MPDLAVLSLRLSLAIRQRLQLGTDMREAVRASRRRLLIPVDPHASTLPSPMPNAMAPPSRPTTKPPT